MGLCNSKPSPNSDLFSRKSGSRTPNVGHNSAQPNSVSAAGGDERKTTDRRNARHETDDVKKSPFFSFYSPSPAHFLFSKKSPARSPANASANSTPKRFFRKPFPPPSPAKHIRAVLARRHGSVKPNEASIPEGSEAEGATGLDKNFGFPKHFASKYEVGEEVGRGHFGYTCAARFKKGELKGQQVAIKIIPKSKMTTAIAIEDVRREVMILKSLSGHKNLVNFYDAYEDHDNVYIVMELCKGGELLDRILSRGGKYTEEDARAVMVQILYVVAFFHLQGVVHRDLKPENFLFTSKGEDSLLKAIDFGLSDFVKPDERLNDIVGSAYYVAPEVLHRSYSTEADVWSIGVIAYILLCGSRPFWARTESGIFKAVLKADPIFDESPWPSLSSEARDFVKRLLVKDPRKRMSAAQALSHPWIKNSLDVKAPLDILIFKLMKIYMRSSSLRKAALKAVSRTLSLDELFYLKTQFSLLEPSKNGTISIENIKEALTKNISNTIKESRIPDLLSSLNALQYRRMDFEEFCAATLSVHQLEALDRWEQHARCAYDLFEKDGNRAIVIEELASELGLSPSVPVHAVLHDWIRHTDGKLSFLGFVKLLHGPSSRTLMKPL
ncbi:CDPK-related kinase 5-like isoform X1 [Cucurbita moschata]|uniref:non-specific serine/threonine protein kinase n=1 Tax=Cucurbita moschata TaxID=3662 RepID=A0A6J1EIX4_CUCMO|nr:CDPK-related kinase 5-like isoform X1 [Cucurbita moschata]